MELARRYEAEGAEALWNELAEVDPESAAATHMNNAKRVIRALEIYRVSGKTKTELDIESRLGGMRYDACVIGLEYSDREVLYERINGRVGKMLECGLVEEAKRLRNEDVFEKNATAAQAIGYKELISYLNSEATYEQAIEELKRATRNYAKRQITWFSRYKDAEFIYADELGASGSVSSHVIKRIEEKGVKIG
jgi:tRNA dimethylallyltransferase